MKYHTLLVVDILRLTYLITSLSPSHRHTRQPKVMEERQQVLRRVDLVREAGALVQDEDHGAVVRDGIAWFEGSIIARTSTIMTIMLSKPKEKTE